MSANDYDRAFLNVLFSSRRHFWFLHRNRIIYHAIKSHFSCDKIKLLELGTGSANILAYLFSKNLSVDASDIYEESLRHAANYAGKTFVYDVRKEPATSDVKDLKNAYDAVVFGDVIEHLDDPVSTLRHAAYFCKKNGIMIITVPALQQLWSSYDAISGHKKRYTGRILKEEIEKAGLKCISVKYFFFVTAIILFFRRKLMMQSSHAKENIVKDEFKIDAASNFFFNVLCGIELLIGRILDFPFGSSIIAVAQP